MRRLGQDGFTLQELLVIAGIFIIVIIPSLFLVHAKNYDPKERDAERQVAVAQMMQAVRAYVAQNDSLPAGITKTMSPIGTSKGEVNLCPALVPHYLHNLPVDPLISSPPIRCLPKEQYITGYAIQSTGGTHVTIAALAGETRVVYLRD